MRAAPSFGLLALVTNLACTSFRPPAAGVSLENTDVRVSAIRGVTVALPHPDGSGRTLECGARWVQGRIGSSQGDTTHMRTITQSAFDAEAPYACRNVRAGAVTARQAGALTLSVREFDAVKTFTLVMLAGLFLTSVLTAEWEYDTPPAP